VAIFIDGNERSALMPVSFRKSETKVEFVSQKPTGGRDAAVHQS
jgi:hypothetical protein